jgi:NitT/TauT family transport system permease protein
MKESSELTNVPACSRPAPPESRGNGLAKLRGHAFRAALPVIAPICFLAIWAYAAYYTANEIILPGIQSVGTLLAHPGQSLLSMGSLASNIAVSLARVVVGYVVAVIIAVPLGILMGYYATIYKLLNSFMGLFRPIPPLAWVPLVLAWFGVASMANLLGVEGGQLYLYLNNMKLSMIFIIFIGAFYPIFTSSIYGVKSVKKALVDSALVLGAGRADIFLKILIPASAPSIVNGMRIGLGVAWMCLVSAEMLPGSLSGVGYLITHAYTVGRTDVVIAGMISIGVVGATLDTVFRKVEERKFAWQCLVR